MPALSERYSCMCQGPCPAYRGGSLCLKGFVARQFHFCALHRCATPGCSEVPRWDYTSTVTAAFLCQLLTFSSTAEHALGQYHCNLKASSALS